METAKFPITFGCEQASKIASKESRKSITYHRRLRGMRSSRFNDSAPWSCELVGPAEGDWVGGLYLNILTGGVFLVFITSTPPMFPPGTTTDIQIVQCCLIVLL